MTISVNRILSFDQQRSLSPEQIDAYFDWLMARPVKRKNPNAEVQFDYDNEREAMGYLPGEYP